MKYLILAILFFISAGTVAKSGTEIPLPLVSHQAAHEAALAKLLEGKDNIDAESAPAEEYILYSIVYSYQNKSWVWAVHFVHPRLNDHSVTYYVNQNGEAIFQYATE